MKKRLFYSIVVLVFFILGLFVIHPLWSEETMDNVTLETILSSRNTTVEVYFLSFGSFTRFAVNEEYMRDIYYDYKISIRNKSIHMVKDLILALNSFPREDYVNIRILFDILIDNEVIYSLSISSSTRLNREIRNFINSIPGYLFDQ
jgi:hypothetical protein